MSPSYVFQHFEKTKELGRTRHITLSHTSILYMKVKIDMFLHIDLQLDPLVRCISHNAELDHIVDYSHATAFSFRYKHHTSISEAPPH